MATPEMMQYLGVFLDEAREQLELLETNILQMERGDTSEEILQVLFRAAHTVKGSSRAMGFSAVGDLTHHMEDILDNLRSGRQSVTTETVDVLLKCLDMLTALIEEVASTGSTADSHADEVNTLVRRLNALCNAPVAEPVPAPVVKPDASLIVSDYQQAAIDQAVAAQLNVYHVRVTLSTECLMKSVRAYMVLGGLGALGTVLVCSPDEDRLEAEEFDNVIDLIFAGTCEASEIESVLQRISEIADVNVERLELHSNLNAIATVAVQMPVASAETPTPSTNETRKPEASVTHAQTIRVDVARLDNLMNLIGEMVIDRTQIARVASDLRSQYRQDPLIEQLIEGTDRLARITSELQEQVMKARMLPIDGVFQRMPRMVRDIAQKTGKEVRLIIEGGETELDRSVVEVIGDPLIHLLRNSVDHGIEVPANREAAGKDTTGVVKLAARHEENHIVIEITDDGRGIDVESIKRAAVAKGTITRSEAEVMLESEALMLIFRSGVSTAQQLSDISGRGVGMDIVRSNLERIGGRISLNTKVGRGTTFTIRLPLTLAIVRGLTVRAGSCSYVLPLGAVEEMIRLGTQNDDIRCHSSGGQPVIVLRGKTVPLINLAASLVGGHSRQIDPQAYVVVVKHGARRIGIAVDGLAGEQEVVIKSLGSYLGDVPGVAGATILGDGSVALIVDVEGLTSGLSDASTSRHIPANV